MYGEHNGPKAHVHPQNTNVPKTQMYRKHKCTKKNNILKPKIRYCTCECAHICMHAHANACAHVHLHAHLHAHPHECAHARMHASRDYYRDGVAAIRGEALSGTDLCAALSRNLVWDAVSCWHLIITY